LATDALKITTSLSTPFIVAGAPFTITTTLVNAHDGPIQIQRYDYHLPCQVQWIKDTAYHEAFEARRGKHLWRRLLMQTPLASAAQAPGEVMSYGPKDPGAIAQELFDVQSGETTSYTFKAVVPHWLFTSGSEIVFVGRVTYKYHDGTHTSPFEVRVALRPPLVSNITGAVIGGLLGTAARFLRDTMASSAGSPGLPFWSSSALAVILGVIAVVFASRKSADVQPIFAIEDVWGGMLAGFLIGYFGADYFAQVIGMAGTGTHPSP